MSETLPQPPPNAPMPPPSEAALRSRAWRSRIFGVGILAVIALLLYGLSIPYVHRAKKNGDLAQASSNLRQISYALIEFDSKYGRFPDDTTVAKVEAKGVSLPLGNASSNDYFRQLIVAGIAPNESMFYAKTPDTHKPDNVMNGKWAIGKGECAFAYIPGASSSSAPGTPFVVFPLVRGKLLFDHKLCKKKYGGKAIILRTGPGGLTYPVDKSGHVKINGKDLFDPSQPFWNGKAPVVKWPE